MPRGKVLTSAGHHSFFLKSAHTRAESDILAQSGFKQSPFPIPVSCCSSIFEESLDFCEILCSVGFGFFNPSSFSKSASLLSVTFLFLFETGSSSGVTEKCQIKHQTWIKLADNCVLPCEWLWQSLSLLLSDFSSCPAAHYRHLPDIVSSRSSTGNQFTFESLRSGP